jgi:hypothetical protein
MPEQAILPLPPLVVFSVPEVMVLLRCFLKKPSQHRVRAFFGITIFFFDAPMVPD